MCGGIIVGGLLATGNCRTDGRADGRTGSHSAAAQLRCPPPNMCAVDDDAIPLGPWVGEEEAHPVGDLCVTGLGASLLHPRMKCELAVVGEVLDCERWSGVILQQRAPPFPRALRGPVNEPTARRQPSGPAYLYDGVFLSPFPAADGVVSKFQLGPRLASCIAVNPFSCNRVALCGIGWSAGGSLCCPASCLRHAPCFYAQV